eukprot:CAMPEP_0184507442 /NCGR_PEP_ID=MMETSP0198_2-20121128/244_1 /TAXON_ID=1112570 /ORGANISM="Thraustochytrium sp., Strain LLF1b" /LENGTH=165 /DNA_ID=CAMNT_0026897189 /DNA_START=23 /DNA_END=517 /DNA_ORIENTATION=+
MASGFIPPVNYGMVEEDLHRSGQPNEMNLRFIERLNLNKVIYLSPDDPDLVFQHFLEDNDIELVHLGANESIRSPWSPISEEIVLEALCIILDESNYPLHVMDHQGSHRTGTVLGCLRKAQRWSLTSVFDEYRRFAGSKVRLANEQFIELFDTDLVDVPPNPPKW